MKDKKYIKFGMFLLVGVLLVSFSSASYMSSNVQYAQPGSGFSTGGSWQPDSSMCEAGQDFVIQITPFGCTPAIVRSDLLEEQNVPVFCQLGATKINPLIEVEAIESISFSGKYPEEVSGVGFLPARAALGVSGNLNSPVLNNIGSVVVVLKEQENASAMPDFVDGNLTAKIKYDIKNAFGIGKASFYLPEMSDEDWEKKHAQYGFWNRRFYLRAEAVDEEGAAVSIYDDTRKLSSVNLEKGEKSRMIYLPGFDCLAGLELKLDGLEDPDTRAKLNINGEIVEVADKERFLENRCWVREIDKNGLDQTVIIRCNGDEGSGLFGSKPFTLMIKPRVKLEISGDENMKGDCVKSEEGCEIGDILYKLDNQGEKFVYLGYLGEDSEGIQFIVPVVSTERTKEDFLKSTFYRNTLPTMITSYIYTTKNIVGDSLKSLELSFYGTLSIVGNKFISGSYPIKIINLERKENVGFFLKSSKFTFNEVSARATRGISLDLNIPDIKFKGFAGAQDESLGVSESKEDISDLKIGSPINKEADYKRLPVNSKVEVPEVGEFIKIEDNKWKKIDTGIKFTSLEMSESEYENVTIIFIATPSIKEDSKLKENYENAMKDYDRIIESYGNEKYIEGFDEITFGEEALYKKILFAWDMKQKKSVVELCGEFRERYPNSKKILKEQCDNLPKLSSSESSSIDVLIDGVVRRITFEGIYEPSFDDYGAEVYFSGKSGGKGESINQRGIRLIKGMKLPLLDDDFVELKEVGEDYIIVRFNVKETTTEILKSTVKFSGVNTKIKLNDYVTHVGENDYKFGVTTINLKKLAKVSVSPNINNVGTEADFGFRIGIEKRAIQLSPEKTREKIESLNETIKEWEEKSEQLGKVVQGLKASCLGVGAMLIVKNLFANTGGKAIARQNVMRGDGGINDMCADAINGEGIWKGKGYKTLNECFTKQAGYIDDMVDEYQSALEKQNTEIKKLQENYETREFLTETHIDTGEFGKKYIPIVKNELRQNLDGEREIDVGGGEKVKVSEILNMVDSNTTSIEQARGLQLNYRIDSDMAKEQLDKELIEIYVNNKDAVERSSFAERTGFPEAHIISFTKSKNEIPFTQNVEWKTVSSRYEFQNGGSIDKDSHVQNYKDPVSGGEYILVLSNDNVVDKTYKITDTTGEGADKKITLEQHKGTDANNEGNPLKLIFKKYDTSTYQNKYENPVELSYYETEPYKGLPAIVPFDCTEGWYASVSQTLPMTGSIASYDASGRVSSLYVCNVGENGKEENKKGDDICQMINLGTGQAYNVFHGLDSGKATKLIQDAVKVVADASRKYKSGISGYVPIGNCRAKVGKPAVDIPDMQCQDFMSPKDCQLLFNVCDPVICPSSRCDFGGSYPVRDVIQSGIIGSLVLCLPNIREGIYIPVCLTGIKAGIDGLISVMTSYRDCLQESLDTGKMVGICDEIYSIHLCDFFWRQTLPLANLIIPKMMEIVMGQNVRGGGEYLGVSSAWDNAGKSVDYFTQYYAAEAYASFKARITEGVSDAVCDVFISGSYPEGGNLLESLTEPDSPPQWYGRFDEIPFTTATVPPISHYKVFYHIYAGEESRAYYKVYLRSPPGSSFYQDTAVVRFVASGYIPAGDYATDTPDFTAPSGYKEMCIMVNGQEECGFDEVSTSYAINYMKDEYVKEQAGERDIKTETECVAGTVSAYSLLTPSIEGAADEMINPAIYNKGIIRICATESPGKGTDGLDGSSGARWVRVGYCGDQNMKCWLDTKSVKNAVEFDVSAEDVLEEQSKQNLEILMSEGNYSTWEQVSSKIDEIKKESTLENKIELIDEIFDKVFWNDQKAELLLLRGNAYAMLAMGVKSVEDREKVVTESKEEVEEEDEEVSEEDEEEVEEEKTPEIVSIKLLNKPDDEESQDHVGLNKEFYLKFETQNCERVKYEIRRNDSPSLLDPFGYDNLIYDGETSLVSEREFINPISKEGKYYVKAFCIDEDDKKVSKEKREDFKVVTSPGVGRELPSEEEKEREVEDCKIIIGNEIIKIAQSKKTADSMFSDETIKEDTGAKNFECLVLMQAYQESTLQHCIKEKEDNNCLYCDKDGLENLRSKSGEESYGVMQINIGERANPDMKDDVDDFYKNIEFGINYLIKYYNPNTKSYNCGGKNYKGWQRALRYYNGWNTDCSKGDVDYVENVLGRKDEIESLFEECK